MYTPLTLIRSTMILITITINDIVCTSPHLFLFFFRSALTDDTLLNSPPVPANTQLAKQPGNNNVHVDTTPSSCHWKKTCRKYKLEFTKRIMTCNAINYYWMLPTVHLSFCLVVPEPFLETLTAIHAYSKACRKHWNGKQTICLSETATIYAL